MPALQKGSVNEKPLGFRGSRWEKGQEFWPLSCLRLALLGLSFPGPHLESSWGGREKLPLGSDFT